MSNVFIPGGTTLTIAADSDGDSVSLNGDGDVLRIISLNSTLPAHIRAGAGAQTPADSDYPVIRGEPQYLFIGFAADTVGVKMPAGGNSGTVYITRGSVR